MSDTALSNGAGLSLINSSTPTPTMDYPILTSGAYPATTLIATFSLLISILIIPPMLWHLRNRNLGATSLILWVLLLTTQMFINALIWPNDNTAAWFNGRGLCDIEVKIQVASTVGFPASAASVLRALARVMDTERASLGLTKQQRRRGYAVDVLWCAGFPALQMLFHYFVQAKRYYIYGISGCVSTAETSWLMDLLMVAPPVIWTLICTYYAALVLYRLHRYRRNFANLVAHSNTNKSRFLRLFLICLAWLAIAFPLEAYTIWATSQYKHQPYSWTSTHDPKKWDTIELMYSQGQVRYIRYIWLTIGVLVFLAFGLGKDAVKMYRRTLLDLGFGRCMPSLRKGSSPRAGSVAATLSSVSSRAKLVFSRKSSPTITANKTWATDSGSLKITASSSDDPVSPKTTNFPKSVHDIEKARPILKPTRFQRLTAAFAPLKKQSITGESTHSDGMDLDVLVKKDLTVSSTISVGESSPSLLPATAQSRDEVYVRREVRQGSEVALS